MFDVAIQGEFGSNSHMAALRVFQPQLPPVAYTLVPMTTSYDLFRWLTTFDEAQRPRCAVLPIENSLHGSVFEHYDLLLEHDVRIAGETLLHIRHNVIAAPGVALRQIREVHSHPVALSQCRQWLRRHAHIRAVSANDTAGSVRELMAAGRSDLAAIAPELAAERYGAQVLEFAIEDHAENYTRFLLLVPAGADDSKLADAAEPNKASLAFTLEHQPGTLLAALKVFEAASMNLTRIESRPVPGRPWEYVFFVDVRFAAAVGMEQALAGLEQKSRSMQVLGIYRAAELPVAG